MNAKDSKFAVCRHVKTNGRRCQSPALTGGALCYFHRNLHRAHRRPLTAEKLVSTWQEETLQAFRGGGEDPLAIARAYPQQNDINFPPLEDAVSVQLATSMLFQAIATGSIHFKRARMLLYTLKIACINQRALSAALKLEADSSSQPTRIVRTAHGHALAAPDDNPSAPASAPTVAPTAPPERATHQKDATKQDVLLKSTASEPVLSKVEPMPITAEKSPRFSPWGTLSSTHAPSSGGPAHHSDPSNSPLTLIQ
jgi:hypothetical protein